MRKKALDGIGRICWRCEKKHAKYIGDVSERQKKKGRVFVFTCCKVTIVYKPYAIVEAHHKQYSYLWSRRRFR